MPERIPFARLHRFLLRLHPARFRTRFGQPAHALFVEWVTAAVTDEQRRQRARRAVLEAGETLAAAWWQAARRLLVATLRSVELGRAGGRAGVRAVRRRPMQTTVIVATMMIAVGANTSLFAVARALLIRPLAYEHAERVVVVLGGDAVEMTDSGARINESFAALPGVEQAAYYLERGSASMIGGDEVVRIRLAQVSPAFFETLGVRFGLGRGIRDSDEAARVAVIAHGLWQSAFGGEPDVIGRVLRLSGLAYTVVGVAPAEVAYPPETDAWLSMPTEVGFLENAFDADAIARLAPGADRLALEAVLVERTAEERQKWETEGFTIPSPRLVPLREYLVGDISRALWILVGAAVVVFLLGGLNLAGIWIDQATERADELRMRRALGASRARVFGHLLAETVTVGVIGGVAATLAAVVAADVMRAHLPAELPGVSAIGVNLAVVAVALGLSILAGMGFGGAAAWRGARLSSGGIRKPAVTLRTRRLQSALVIGQGALALILVVGAGLMVRSFQNLEATPLGFDPLRTLSLRVLLPDSEADTPDARRSYAMELERRLLELPGVVSVGLGDSLPLSFARGAAFSVRLPGDAENAPIVALTTRASPAYFAAAGIPLIAGRPFPREVDSEGGLIVDERLAGSLFGDQNAVGQTVEFLTFVDGEGIWVQEQVRGVAGRVHSRGARSNPFPVLYRALGEHPTANLGAVVRSSGDPATLVEAVRAAALAVNPAVAPYDIKPLYGAVRDLIAADQALAAVSSGFSVAALLLAALGLYGVISQQVSRRQGEFGVRLALGARPRGLIRSVVGRGVALGLVAVAIGVPATLVTTRALRSRLFGITPFDPTTLALGCAFVVVVSLLAAWVPARRIARVDPCQSLAAE